MFNIGDRVVVKSWEQLVRENREFVEDDWIDRGSCFTNEMQEYCGKVGEIVDIGLFGRYEMSFDGAECEYVFDDWMLTLDTEIREGDWVRIKTWKELSRKYGEKSDGDVMWIETPSVDYVERMKKFGNMVARVRCIDGDLVKLEGNPVFDRMHGNSWNWSKEMLKK